MKTHLGLEKISPGTNQRKTPSTRERFVQCSNNSGKILNEDKTHKKKKMASIGEKKLWSDNIDFTRPGMPQTPLLSVQTSDIAW